MSGPLAPASALCNAATCLQQQVDWVCDCIVALRSSGKAVIEPSAEKEEEWVSHHLYGFTHHMWIVNPMWNGS